MEYIHRDSRDVPFGWFELLRAALAAPEPVRRPKSRRPEPRRLQSPDHFRARPTG